MAFQNPVTIWYTYTFKLSFLHTAAVIRFPNSLLLSCAITVIDAINMKNRAIALNIMS